MNIRRIILIVLIGAGMVGLCSPIFAMQGNRVGLAVEPSIFGLSPSILGFFHVTDEIAVKPRIALSVNRSEGETESSFFLLGTAVDYYLTPEAQASPYFGIDVGLLERTYPGEEPDTADTRFLTYLAPRVGAQVMFTNLIGLYAHGGLQIDIFTDGTEMNTFTTGLGVVLYLY